MRVRWDDPEDADRLLSDHNSVHHDTKAILCVVRWSASLLTDRSEFIRVILLHPVAPRDVWEARVAPGAWCVDSGTEPETSHSPPLTFELMALAVAKRGPSV